MLQRPGAGRRGEKKKRQKSFLQPIAGQERSERLVCSPRYSLEKLTRQMGCGGTLVIAVGVRLRGEEMNRAKKSKKKEREPSLEIGDAFGCHLQSIADF